MSFELKDNSKLITHNWRWYVVPLLASGGRADSGADAVQGVVLAGVVRVCADDRARVFDHRHSVRALSVAGRLGRGRGGAALRADRDRLQHGRDGRAWLRCALRGYDAARHVRQPPDAPAGDLLPGARVGVPASPA